MPRITPDDLTRIREQMAGAMNLREGEARAKVTVHMGTCGIAAGARKIMSVLMELREKTPEKDIILTTSGCAGLCSREPMVTIELRGEAPVKYVDLDEKKTKQIFQQHVLSGTLVKRYALAIGSERVGSLSASKGDVSVKAYRTHLMLCTGTGCVSNKAFKVREVLAKELEKQGLQDEIAVVSTGCNGFCAQGPVMVVQPEATFYQLLSEREIPRLVEEHFLKGRPVQRLMFTPPGEQVPVPTMNDIGFFSKQRLITLRNRGMIDPEKIDEYIGRGGYAAAAKALTSMTPMEIIEEIKQSGLRGRGGAGFPTGVKWEICSKSPGRERHLVCNGDEGDPGAFMDRSIVESDPHTVLEGMLIGAKAIGASRGYIYIRHEYPLAMNRLNIAIEQAKEYGLLGEDILETGFNFNVSIWRGAGAFVCGEETSLTASLQGLPPEPRERPPFPAESGIKGQPTNINNVETWASVPEIINRGAARFSNIGTKTSKGTKVFSLVGKVKNTGLVEVPMGITLREIVFDIGGGPENGAKFKAVQTGGPSGGCIPESLLDLPVDYEMLAEVGSIMGSGGLIVMDENTCMVDVARYFIEFLRDESCGKCTACREGLDVMCGILTRICEGEGKESDMPLLQELSQAVKAASLCGLGGTAPNPVLSTIRYFPGEYEAHILDKSCPAGVCKTLFHYRIDEELCEGCGACEKSCPHEAIEGEKDAIYQIVLEKCNRCGACYDVCPKDAVVKTPNSRAKVLAEV